MRKLTLDPESLAVDSFVMSDLPELRGTVQGAEDNASRTSCGLIGNCTCPPP
jgi:hypothetical protein